MSVTVSPALTNYWAQAQLYDQNTLLSIGTQITSEMAFLTMFNEWGSIEGGKTFGAGEFSSEASYGVKRYWKELRMMFQETDGGCDEGRKLPVGCPELSDSALLDASPRGRSSKDYTSMSAWSRRSKGVSPHCPGGTKRSWMFGMFGLLYIPWAADLWPLVAGKKELSLRTVQRSPIPSEVNGHMWRAPNHSGSTGACGHLERHTKCPEKRRAGRAFLDGHGKTKSKAILV